MNLTAKDGSPIILKQSGSAAWAGKCFDVKIPSLFAYQFLDRNGDVVAHGSVDIDTHTTHLVECSEEINREKTEPCTVHHLTGKIDYKKCCKNLDVYSCFSKTILLKFVQESFAFSRQISSRNSKSSRNR